MRSYLVLIGVALLTACSGHDDSDSKSGGSTTGEPTTGGSTTGSPTSSTRVALDVKSFCNKAVTTCGDSSTTESDCEAMFAAVRVTKECASALSSASCEDLSGGSGPVASCFPSCSTPGASVCNGDGTLSICGNASKALVYDCAATCSEVGKSGTGKCGAAKGDQGSSGQRCLCE